MLLSLRTAGDVLSYDKLLVATGSSARKLRIPGADLPQVVTIRGPDDAQKVVDVCTGATDVVIVGAGFIGLETAVALLNKFPVSLVCSRTVASSRLWLAPGTPCGLVVLTVGFDDPCDPCLHRASKSR